MTFFGLATRYISVIKFVLCNSKRPLSSIMQTANHRAEDQDVVSLDAVLEHIWASLGRGVVDRKHGFHHPVVATISHEGKPRSRVVILREADQNSGVLRFHTDIRSEKCRDLESQKSISVTCYDETTKQQLRIDGEATLHSVDGIADLAWESSQRMSRMAYGVQPATGSMITARDDFQLPLTDVEIDQGRAYFGAVVIHVHTLEWLYLRAGGHRRVVFNLQTNTQHWLVP
jgi:pyridoxamine 5'-phosphate oxidase